MHDCNNCGCACYCHGDIDDCQVETIEYAYEHCEGCGCEEEPDEGWPEDPEPVSVVCPICKMPREWRSAIIKGGESHLCADKFHEGF